jgi:tripartite-type tricarboxylate transporter receptor subunit TctC
MIDRSIEAESRLAVSWVLHAPRETPGPGLRCRRLRLNAVACVVTAGCLAIAAVPALGAATGSDFPTRPVRILVPVTSGGNMDGITRALAQKLTESLGQQVIVDNRPGAGGRVAFEILAGAAPDGHTLMTTSLTSIIHPMLYKSRLDILRDFVPVSHISSQGYVLVVNNAVPAKTPGELVAHLKANPGKLAYMSTGIGSPNHLTAEVFQAVTGTRMLHVPYKGSAYADIVSGLIQVGFPGVPTIMPFLQGGRLRAIAVTTPKRVAPLPDVPTLIESGMDGAIVVNWYGIVAPRHTPGPLAERLAKHIASAMHSPEVGKRLRADSTDPVGSSPAQFVGHIRAESERWGRIVKQAEIRGE